jgi:molybdopterin-guanine dinucleotide biosynthesis protein A
MAAMKAPVGVVLAGGQATRMGGGDNREITCDKSV